MRQRSRKVEKISQNCTKQRNNKKCKTENNNQQRIPHPETFLRACRNKYAIKTQEYIKLNKHMVDEIRYIFKMRIGCDGSRETLFTRKLITSEELRCHCCGIIETRKHIIEECELYRYTRRRLLT